MMFNYSKILLYCIYIKEFLKKNIRPCSELNREFQMKTLMCLPLHYKAQNVIKRNPVDTCYSTSPWLAKSPLMLLHYNGIYYIYNISLNCFI